MSCGSCLHERRDHGPRGKGVCSVCACYGYWAGIHAKHCDNPKCKGDVCVEGRRAAKPAKSSRAPKR